MALRVSRNERRILQETVRHATGEARLHRRARIILLACEGETVSGIARKVGTCRSRVLDWITRFKLNRLEGLADVSRRGRPPEITSLERHITLDRALYGSDQSASVEIGGFKRLVDMVRTVDSAMGDGAKSITEAERPIREKLAPLPSATVAN